MRMTYGLHVFTVPIEKMALVSIYSSSSVASTKEKT
jgi:hypothetical protein